MIAKQCVDDESAVILDIYIEIEVSYTPSVRDEGGTNSLTDCGNGKFCDNENHLSEPDV